MDIKNITGKVHSIETFGLVDGPGVRSVVFLSGCGMRCKFCHNPDTWNSNGEIRTAEDVFSQLRRYRTYWRNNGGITISGGEPLLQKDFAEALFTLAKKENIHTAVDTAGQPFSLDKNWLSGFERLAGVTDLFILDLKMMDPEKHRRWTGRDNELILRNLKKLAETPGAQLILRIPVIPGVNDNMENMEQTADFILNEMHGKVRTLQLLSFMRLGMEKYESLGMPYQMTEILKSEHFRRDYFQRRIERFAEHFNSRGIHTLVGTREKQ